MMRALEGRTAVVTGAGTGQAIAEAFAAEGAFVLCAGRTEAAIAQVASCVGGLAVPCDVTVLADVERLFARATGARGRVDVFVNNAGQTGPVGAMADVDLDAWRACAEVSLFGAMHGLGVAASHGWAARRLAPSTCRRAWARTATRCGAPVPPRNSR